MTTSRFGQWMQTASGKQFWPRDPRPEEIDIADIGHALAIQNRYAGHSRVPFSVAEHSVRASQIVSPAVAFEALMHDAAEAYLVDLPRPVKTEPDMVAYRRIEDNLLAVIAARFGFAVPLPAEVHRADQVMLATEKRDLMAPEPAAWGPLPDPLPEVIRPWTWRLAERRFMARFNELHNERVMRSAWHKALVEADPATGSEIR